MAVLFKIVSKLTIDTVQISPAKLEFGKIFERTASRISLKFDNKSLLPQELIFYPLPREISIEPDLIPLKILPREKLEITLVYRGKEIKKDESFIVKFNLKKNLRILNFFSDI